MNDIRLGDVLECGDVGKLGGEIDLGADDQAHVFVEGPDFVRGLIAPERLTDDLFSL